MNEENHFFFNQSMNVNACPHFLRKKKFNHGNKPLVVYQPAMDNQDKAQF